MHPSNDPLHGVTLEKMVTFLSMHYGWKKLGELIEINCFRSNPTIKSSLTFLRRTPWARQKVEELYIKSVTEIRQKKKGTVPKKGQSE